MGNNSTIEWTDATWSPLRVRVRENAADIARAKGYSSLVKIGEEMASRVGQHCEHVSEGCRNCYSGTWQGRRLKSGGTGLPFDRRSRDLIEPFVDGKILMQPLRWRAIRVHEDRCCKTALGKQAHCTCVDKYRFRERRIFVENQSDLFGDWFTDAMLDEVFGMTLATQMLDNRSDHSYQVLTKRPLRMFQYFTERSPAELLKAWAGANDGIISLENENVLFSEMVASATCHDWDADGTNSSRSEYRPWGYTGNLFPLPNVWLGVSVEDQATADARIPLLLQTPAAKRFVSYEPALGPVDFRDYLAADRICWVIVGGES